MIRIWPLYLFDDTTSATSGGTGAAPPAAQPSADTGSGAGTSAPVRIPDSPDEPAPDHDAFAGMEDSDFDLVELPTEEAPQVGETGGPKPTATPPAAAAPQPATEAAKAPPQATQQPPVAPGQDAQQAPRSPLEQAIEGFRTNHKELATWASTNLFALSKEESDLLETDAVTAIPLLMGKVYSQALQATTNLIKNFVPNMVNEGVQTTNARTAKATEALQEFYASNAHLNPQQHGALVDKWARAFRAANPSASRQEAIKFVGNAVSSELGLSPAQAGNGRAAPRPQPFAPARPGTRVQQPSQPHDPYEGMDMEYDQ